MLVVFDFRAFGRCEAQAAHDVFELVDGLGDRVQFADPPNSTGQGCIELGVASGLAIATTESALGVFEGCLDGLLDGIQFHTGFFFAFARDAAHVFLQGFELAFFRSQEFYSGGVKFSSVCRSSESGRGRLGQFIQLLYERLDGHNVFADERWLKFGWKKGHKKRKDN